MRCPCGHRCVHRGDVVVADPLAPVRIALRRLYPGVIGVLSDGARILSEERLREPLRTLDHERRGVGSHARHRYDPDRDSRPVHCN